MKEQWRTAERFLLTAPTKTIIQSVTRLMARATVDTLLSLLFVQNYLQNTVLQYYQVLQCAFHVIVIYHVQNCLRVGH